MKTLSIILLMVPMISGLPQNINYEWISVKLYRTPLHPLAVSERTFSVAVVDLGNPLGTSERENLQHAIALPGFSHVRDHAAVEVEVVLGSASITDKELKDKPLTIEKDGVKTVHHQYHYLLNCTFPTKLRLKVNGQYIEEDFPAFFQTKYYGRKSNDEIAFIDEFERDYSFRQLMYKEKLSERVKEINTFLSNQYGYSMHAERFGVGYVKDKDNEYADVLRGMARVRELFMSMDGKEQYLDESFRARSAEATEIFRRALSASSMEKKARINPKVTAMIHYNLALISFALQQFDVAREHLEQAKKGSGGTQAEAASLFAKNADYERRMLARRNAPPPQIPEPVVAVEQTALALAKTGDNYIIGKQHDTLQVAFIFPPASEMPFGDSVWIQDRIIIDGEQKHLTIGPRDISGFCHNNTYFEALWWVDDVTVRPWTTAYKFCKEITRGAITVFACHEVVTDDEGYNKVLTNHYYRDGAEGYKQAVFLSFKRGVSKLVADFPALSEQVRNGEFTRDDFLSIVHTYNQYKSAKTNSNP